MGKLFGKKNDDRFQETLDALETYGAKMDAIKNNLCRPPSEVNHLQREYETAYPQVLNGETSGIHVRQQGNDGVVQELIVTFGKRAYSPAILTRITAWCRFWKAPLPIVSETKPSKKGSGI